MTDSKETLYTIALTRINYFSLAGMLELYRRMGSATAIMENRRNIRDILPDASPRLVEALADISDPMRRAESELEYDTTHGIEPVAMNDPRYPQRLRECDDAPLMLFCKGTADLNQRRVVSIVGTRHCTAYGQDLIRRFMADLRTLCPEVLVVSGLAYGVDINAHRQALTNGYETVAVLAHGLDYLYPARHKATADEMTRHGALVTEFLTGTNADKVNFVRRNRIVAGMADATILVESAAHGGGLITTGIAQTYNRDVFAFPGAVGSPYSEGCNNLIRDNGAGLVSCAADFARAMGWTDDSALSSAKSKGIERQLFPDLTAPERLIVDTLKRANDLQINMLAAQTNIPIQQITSTLFSLEMKGVVKMFAGGTYHLLQ